MGGKETITHDVYGFFLIFGIFNQYLCKNGNEKNPDHKTVMRGDPLVTHFRSHEELVPMPIFIVI